MAAILELALAAIVGMIAIVIFVSVKGALNTAAVSTGALSLINLIDLLLAAGLVVGIVVIAFAFARGR